jgi:hypothetical protein
MVNQTDFDRAFDAIPADRLREYVRGFVLGLDDRLQSLFLDGLVSTAARCNPEFSPRAVEDLRLVEDAALWMAERKDQVPVSIPRLDFMLERANRQFMSGNLERALQSWDHLFRGIELWSEQHPEAIEADNLLVNSVNRAAVRYLVCVFINADPAMRAGAILNACRYVGGVAWLRDPLQQMRDEAPLLVLDDMNAFEAEWQRTLQASIEHERTRHSEAVDVREELGWLAKSVARSGGADGIALMARLSGEPVTWEEWVRRLVADESWTAIGPAVDEAIQALGASLFTSRLADVAAGAARLIHDHAGAAEWARRAFLAEPTLVRLLMWRQMALDAGFDPTPAFGVQLRRTRSRFPSRVAALLLLLTGRWSIAAGMLNDCPGLGWSTQTHPGALLFAGLVQALHSWSFMPRNPEESSPGNVLNDTVRIDEQRASLRSPGIEDFDGSLLPPVRLPSTIAQILPPRDASLAIQYGMSEFPLDENLVEELIESLRNAALGRLRAVLQQGRRRAYANTASLILALVEVLILLDRRMEARALIRRTVTESSGHALFQSRLDEMTSAAVRTALKM